MHIFLKEMFGPKDTLGQKSGKKNFWSTKNYGKEKFWVQIKFE